MVGMKLQIDLKVAGVVCLIVVAFAIAINNGQGSLDADQPDSAVIPADQAQPMKDVSCTEALSGMPVRLSDCVRKTPVILAFWASYCHYCPAELAVLQEYAAKHAGQVQVIAINSYDGAAAIRAFEQKQHLNFPTLIDPDADVVYSVTELPHLYVIDTKGRIRLSEDGWTLDSSTRLPGLFDQVLAACSANR